MLINLTKKDRYIMKYFFIENPEAGSKKIHTIMARIKAALKDNECCTFIDTEYPGHATKIAKEISSEHDENATIVVCGGDGTLGEVASGTMGSKTALALLPMGSGNDFARKIFGSLSLEEIASGYGFLNNRINADIIDIDYIEANEKCCVNVMSLGLDTKILKIANKLTTKFPFLGSFAYKVAVVMGIFGELGTKAKFELDIIDENGNIETITSEPNFTLAAFCNGSYYGGGFCPAKDSEINDGIIDMIIADRLTIVQVPGIIGKYSKGVAHLTHPKIVRMCRLSGGRLFATPGTNLDFNCDGNPMSTDKVDFKIVKGGLRLACFKNEALDKAIAPTQRINI